MSLSHIHIFEPASETGLPAMVLLHGTGGDETQLLDFGRQSAPGAALLSVRGRVLEQGKCRFFRRFSDGRLDEEDVLRRSGELATFFEESRRNYALGTLLAIGYSNGANIAAGILQCHPDVFSGAILGRAVAPFSDPPRTSLSNKRVVILSGEADTVAPPERGAALAEQLRAAGAGVKHHVLPCEHARSPDDARIARDWLRREGFLHGSRKVKDTSTHRESWPEQGRGNP
jgi:phospholipase/carboxylesterase